MARWRRSLALLCTAVSALIASCGGEQATGPAATPTGQPKPVASVQITPSADTLTALGATRQFQAVAKDADGNTVAGKTFSWTSASSSVATVDSSGLATAVSNGSATIRATTEGVSGTASLTVAQAVASVQVIPPQDTLTALGDTVRFTATARDSRDSVVAGAAASWTSSDTTVATIDTSGLATAVSNGSATISGEVNGTSDSADVVVSQTVSTIAVTPTSVTLTALGDTVRFSAVASDANGHDVAGQAYLWSSSDESIATVDSAGLAAALTNGTVTIVATAREVSGSATLTIGQVPAGVNVSPSVATMSALGDTLRFTAEALDANGNPMSGVTFAWRSSNPSVATIDASTGLATAVGNGSTEIRSTINGIEGTASLMVAQAVASVDVTPAQETLTALGDTLRLSASAKDARANPVAGKSASWASSDTSVVSVDVSGLAIAVGNGTATITATVDGVSGQADLTVHQTVATVAVTPAVTTLEAIGDTARFTATARDANGYEIPGRIFQWTSSDESVATVDSAGLATAVGTGSATIGAATDTASGSAALMVSQVVVTVAVAPENDTLRALGDTRQFTAQALDGNGNPVSALSFSWSSSDDTVATIDASTGLATALGNGATTISASAAGITGTATLTVAQMVTSVRVAPGQATVTAFGETVQFTATPEDSRGNPIAGKAVTWNSSEILVATVDADGLVTAIGDGAATITATVEGVQGSATLTVNQSSALLALTTQPAGANAGEPLATQPALQVRDARGNLVAKDNTTVVTAAIASGAGTLTGNTAATAVGGNVTYTDLGIGGTVGDRTLAFTATGLTAATSDPFTVDPGPAAQLALHAGDNQTALAGTTLPVAFSVRVTDAFDNNVPGTEVAWSVTSGSGSLSDAVSTSDTAGLAATTYTLGRYAAIETVDATAAGLAGSPVTFSTTATPNGTISGTITLSNVLLAPPLAAKAAAADATLAPPSISKLASKPGLRSVKGTPRRLRPPRTEPEYVPDELIVTFRPAPLSVPPVGSMAMAAGPTAKRVAGSIRTALASHVQPGRLTVAGVSPAILAARIKVADPSQVEAIAAELRTNSSVATVERNPIVRLESTARRTAAAASIVPNDPLYPWQAWHYAMIDAPEAWSITTGSASVIVAVVDDGIRFDHPGIAANLTGDGYDFVANDALVNVCGFGFVGRAGDGDGFDADPTNPFDGVWNSGLGCYEGNPSGNHGLHVAGTVAAVGNDAAGGTGVNWTARIRPIRVFDIEGISDDYWIAQGSLYAAGLPADDGAGGTVQAASGARVINMSLGEPSPSTVLENAMISATNAGALIVAAAGNAGTSDPRYPAAYPQTLSVSAVGPDATLASYSSFGSTIDIAAPGGDLADGDSTFGVTSTAWNYVSGTAIYGSWQGTSMAAPHVSGVAALLLAQNPTLTAADLRARLINYAVDVGVPGRDDFYGAGIVNARNSLTQSVAPPRDLYARLLDASSGAILQTALVAIDGSFAFTELPDGDYYVFAGQDQDGDGQIGLPVRRWGAYGGAATPTAVTVDGAGQYPASFAAGFPSEFEPNNTLGTGDALPIGGYLLGTISDATTDIDVTRVEIPNDGQYTFETTPWDGACGFALEENTILGLYDASGSLITSNDDIDFASANLCSRITGALTAGTYYLAVIGYYGLRYAVVARQGT